MNSNTQPRSLPTDPVSEVLHRWHLPDWFAGFAEFNSPWGITVPRGQASLYVMLAGQGLLTLEESGIESRLESGEILLLAQGSAHRLQDSPDSPTTPFRQCLGWECSHPPRPLRLPSSTKIIYGYFSVTSCRFRPLTSGIPPVLRLRMESSKTLRRCEALTQAVSDEQTAAALGWQAIVDHLVQILLFQTLRAFALNDSNGNGANRSESGTPWLKGALDEEIGPALGLIHSRPEKPWTVALLASQVNMSRSAFSERFREVVGTPPLQYLTEYRIQRACQLLRDTELGVKEISSLVGYESASSFSNAFKRWTGNSPGVFRRSGEAEHVPAIRPDTFVAGGQQDR